MAMRYLLLFITSTCLAQQVPVTLRGIQFDYPANQIPNIFFWFEKKTNLVSVEWEVMATITMPDPDSGAQPMAFYRVGVDWRTNAPAWMTNPAPITAVKPVATKRFITAKPPKMP